MCHKSKLGLDLDGITYEFIPPFCKWLRDKLGIPIYPRDVKDYYWFNCVAGMTEQQFWDEFHAFSKSGAYRDFALLPGAQESIRYLLDNYDVKFITARPDYAYEDTVGAIYRDFGICEPDRIIFARAHKSDEILAHGIDIFIEDASHHALDIANKTDAHVYLMDTDYNQDVSHSQITRVQDWAHIMKVLGV
jgi:uncharacterized HAD superfamily protein